MNEHDRCRALVLEADPAVDSVLAHLDACPSCRDLAARVTTLRRVARGMGPGGASPPPGLAERVLAASSTRAGRRRGGRRAAAPAVIAAAVAAVALAASALVVTERAGEGSPADLSNTLLAAAQRAEDAGTTRVQLDGAATVEGRRVRFAGRGALSADAVHYRGVAHAPSGLAPFEIAVVGGDAWGRAPDGTWHPVGGHRRDARARRDGFDPLDRVVLDAGSFLDLLQLPKRHVRAVGDHVAFVVTAASGVEYEVQVWIDERHVLRRVTVAAAGPRWTTRATLRAYGFGVPVAIHTPAAPEQ